MKTQRTRAGFTLIELLVVITIIAILAGLSGAAVQQVLKIGNQTKAVNNCRQVIMALKLFAGRNDTRFPDSVPNPLTGGVPQNANETFHMLFQQGVARDERIFGAPAGYNPDGAIGTQPAYDRAVTPGENHWAMTAGLTDTSPGNMPLVYENPAQPSWPPKWDASSPGQVKAGRVWSGNQIVIGRLDGGVEVVNLEGSGLSSPPKMVGGMDMFTQASEGQAMGILMPVLSAGNTRTDGMAPSTPGRLPVPGGLPPIQSNLNPLQNELPVK
jgi:prepilin-type N-terminal cleavage/methylation domain-containing protein